MSFFSDDCDSATLPSARRWVHIAVAYNKASKTMHIFFDGEEVASCANKRSYLGTDPIYAGRPVEGVFSGMPFKGEMYGTAVYHEPTNASELIQTMYHAQANTNGWQAPAKVDVTSWSELKSKIDSHPQHNETELHIILDEKSFDRWHEIGYPGVIDFTNKAVIIEGLGKIVLDHRYGYGGSNYGRVFSSSCPGGDSSSLTIQNLVLENGVGADATWGTAVNAECGTALIYTCAFRNNEALQAGGVMYVNTAVVRIYGSLFENNGHSHLDGGAIRVVAGGGALSIYHSIFKGNRGLQGGAIYCNAVGSAFLVIEGTTFERNSAVLSGGAIFMQSPNSHGPSSLTTRDTNFEANNATDHGGAFFLSGVPAVVRSSTFTNNEAGEKKGALFYARTMGAESTVVLDECTFNIDVADRRQNHFFAQSMLIVRFNEGTTCYDTPAWTDGKGGSCATYASPTAIVVDTTLPTSAKIVIGGSPGTGEKCVCANQDDRDFAMGANQEFAFPGRVETDSELWFRAKQIEDSSCGAGVPKICVKMGIYSRWTPSAGCPWWAPVDCAWSYGLVFTLPIATRSTYNPPRCPGGAGPEQENCCACGKPSSPTVLSLPIMGDLYASEPYTFLDPGSSLPFTLAAGLCPAFSTQSVTMRGSEKKPYGWGVACSACSLSTRKVAASASSRLAFPFLDWACECAPGHAGADCGPCLPGRWMPAKSTVVTPECLKCTKGMYASATG
jgi:predicted outer membrane repeat protein